MAVAHSAASESHTGTTASTNQTSFSWTHTQTGTPQGVLVFVHTINASDFISSVTYGDLTLERIAGAVAIDTATEPGRTDLFFLGSGLGTGNQTITVNRTNNATVMYASAATVTAATDTALAEVQIREENQAPTEISVTDLSRGLTSLRYAAAYYGGAAPAPQGANSTLLTSIDLGAFGNSMVRETTAGTGARLVGFSANSDDYAAVFAAVTETQNYNIVGGTGKIFLPERNLIKYSEQLDDATWLLSNATVTANAIAAPDGTLTSDLLLEDSTNGGHNVLSPGFPNTGASRYTASIYCKLYQSRGVDFGFASNANIKFNPSAGTVIATGGSPLASGFQNIGNGWYRIYVTDDGILTYRIYAGLTSTISSSSTSYTGNGTGGAYFWGAQVQEGDFSEYDGTFAASVTTTRLLHSVATIGGRGAFALTGNDATLDVSGFSGITAIAAEFTLSGSNAALAHGTQLSGETGAFALTGNNATLTKAAAPKAITADRGQFTLTGNPADLRHNIQTTGERGQFFLPERNMRLWSESFDNAAWQKNNSSITANATTAPDGTLTADALIENTTPSTGHSVQQNITYVTGRTYTASCYFKLYPGPITRYARLYLGPATVFGTDVYLNINIATGTISATVGAPSASGITNEGNGWYRAWLTKQYTGGGITSAPVIQIISTTGTGLYTDADGLSGIYIWGAQFEEGSLSDYDPTGPVAATRTDTRVASRIDGGTGSFALTGNDATLAKVSAKELVVEAGAFALSGNAATLSRSYSLSAETGAFALSGQTVTLADTDKITGETGIFAVAGGNPQLVKSYSLAAEIGSFAINGNTATLRHNVRLDVLTGSFSVAGGAPALIRGFYLSGGAGQFVETGQPATFRRTWAIQAGTGAFAFTGNPASLTETGAYEIDAIRGQLTLVGNAANLAQAKIFAVETALFNLSGQQAGLRHNYKLECSAGQLELTGQNAALSQSQILAAEAGSIALVGGNVSFNAQKFISAENGSFALTGNSILLSAQKSASLDTGAFLLTGNTAALQKQSAKQLNADTGSFSLFGQNANLFEIEALELNAESGSFSLTGNLAALRKNYFAQIQLGQFALNGNAISTSKAYKLSCERGVFSLVGFALVIPGATRLYPEKGAYLLNGNSSTLNYEQRRRVVIIF